MSTISLKNINKYYDDGFHAVKDFNLDIQENEFIVLVGPSGCGKSTTLRMIAGLEDISSGDLLVNDKQMNDIIPKDRDIAMVFQNYALYPHMTVYDNLKFGLKIKKLNKQEIDNRIQKAAEILGLQDYLHKKPKSLSGGQRQRVALGRAMVKETDLFLMDEPLSNLDAKLRVQMRSEIIKLHKRMDTSTIYVTHDQTEAMTMASRIVIMNEGVIQQVGTPKEIYNNPENRFVASFIGSPPMNFFVGKVTDNGFQMESSTIKLSPDVIKRIKRQGYFNKKIQLGVRPENIIYQGIEDNNERTAFQSYIDIQELIGAESLLHSNLSGNAFISKFNSDEGVETGSLVSFAINEEKIHFFDMETEMKINY